LAMAIELSLFGWSAFGTLRQFRHDHEALREQQAAGQAPTDGSPFANQLARTARKLDVPVEQVERVVQDWMFARPGKWLARFARTSLLTEVRNFKAQGGRTALVSDYPAERKLDALGCRDLFDVIVANGEKNGPLRLKPDPRATCLLPSYSKSPGGLLGDRRSRRRRWRSGARSRHGPSVGLSFAQAAQPCSLCDHKVERFRPPRLDA